MKTLRQAMVACAYQNAGGDEDKSIARRRFVSLLSTEFKTGGNNGSRKQKEIHVETETKSGAHRRGLREARRLQERSGESRLGDGEQIRQGRKEKRIGPREEEQQSLLAQRREEGRKEIRREKE